MLRSRCGWWSFRVSSVGVTKWSVAWKPQTSLSFLTSRPSVGMWPKTSWKRWKVSQTNIYVQTTDVRTPDFRCQVRARYFTPTPVLMMVNDGWWKRVFSNVHSEWWWCYNTVHFHNNRRVQCLLSWGHFASPPHVQQTQLCFLTLDMFVFKYIYF